VKLFRSHYKKGKEEIKVATEYSLKISTSREYQQVAYSLSEKFGLELRKDKDESPTYVDLIDIRRPGLLITLTKVRSRTQDLYDEIFGYLPTVNIGFRLKIDSEKEVDQHEQYEEVKSLMIQVVIYLLEQESGDAVFLFNGEITVLQRFKGELILNEKYFRPGVFPLDLVTLPHKIAPIVSLLL
jgi:hypothetical protein